LVGQLALVVSNGIHRSRRILRGRKELIGDAPSEEGRGIGDWEIVRHSLCNKTQSRSRLLDPPMFQEIGRPRQEKVMGVLG
jgi:hypothetical protein